ncbi:LOW QUALITY PROTEIN: glutathione hydrolase 1-like [Dioscorea cayenensis subsp. rotundata]|uniref:Glutathione hydrolase n=1 Tax=Dioscorea cayennensis subsp. rotundata TaxID=55577 RepID=A0AB40AHK9_DIOCR|nr:LOW QUALITY PROTEIN: glutathione hydrolase 1-like [Dioscorea cayenensis subsp. rotundata]
MKKQAKDQFSSLLQWFLTSVMLGKVQKWHAIVIIIFLALEAGARREEIISNYGVVATDMAKCSRIGRDVLKEGGHAVDAAVAAALCLGVVSPASSGIGGGAFMLLRLANGDAQAFDMRETAPAFSSMNMYGGNATLKASGALSIAVPGEVAGLHEAWKQHGKLPWKRLVMPAEHLARRGFRISPYLFMQMNRTKAGILADEGLRSMFTSNGELLQLGDTCYNKRLADTLGVISRHGPRALYNGSVGKNLVRDIRKFGGVLTMKDLQKYKVRVTKPISAEIMGLTILGMPPPSAGGAGIILMLNILAQYGSPSGVSGPLGIHRLIESLKHVAAVRMNLGDPEFVNVSKVLSDMLSPKFAGELRKTIFDNMTFDPSHYGGKWNQILDHGTSHLCVVDKDRNAVSMTSTVNSYFGALYQSPSTGILLNNEMDDFSIPVNISNNVLPPAPANFISPSKRPLSSMAPTIVLKNGQLKAVVGASGGAMIIAATTEVLLNHFAKGMDPLSSILSPRSYHQLIPNVLQYENWTTVTGDHFEVPAETRIALQNKGHVLEGLAGGTISQFVVHTLEDSETVEGVAFGKLTAVSDPRKGGLPAGY